MSDANPIHINGRPLGKIRHVCAFFDHKDQEYRTLLDFVKEGLERREKAVHIVDSRWRESHRARLQDEGIGVEAAERAGQLKISSWEDAYLQDGYFDQDRQLKLIEQILSEGKAQGFPLTRLIANMEWALEDKAGVEDIVEYESRLNYVLPKYDDPVVCTYDLSRFNAGVAMDILRTHPVAIIGGVLQENSLYIPPEDFLKERVARRTPAC